jgi:hypothetical protein
MLILGSSQLNFVVQGLMAAIIIGVFYNLWASTRVYGGLIGKAIRLLGIGILFITIAVIERVMANFNIVDNAYLLSVAQDALNLLGLFFLAMGFSKLASASKA